MKLGIFLQKIYQETLPDHQKENKLFIQLENI